MMRDFCRIWLVGVVLLTAQPFVLAADQAADKAAIEKSIESYTAAFNAGDAKSLAEHWGPEAVYTNPLSGQQVEGREAIAKEFEAILAETNETRLIVDVQSIEFVSPSVAIERGIAKLVPKDSEPTESTYSAVHVKRDGKWLLDRVSEEPAPTVPESYLHLRDLQWMIGTWIDTDEQSTVETTCQWAKNQAFITRAFTVTVADRIDMSGMQIIGWDASTGKIRSWVFDSDGGFGEATWTKRENRWIVDAAGTLPDGRKTSAVNIMTLDDDTTITWQSTGRELDGEILPNIEPIKLVRSSPATSN
ncbi:MAG: SgcJ/EcaC family oxidoreductase [Planctomycetales bacterium]|nr:SgcJ/EcaC family oxidoreductase [Planctomycetales bacterium]